MSAPSRVNRRSRTLSARIVAVAVTLAISLSGCLGFPAIGLQIDARSDTEGPTIQVEAVSDDNQSPQKGSDSKIAPENVPPEESADHPTPSEANQPAGPWDMSLVDTARNADYLTEEEKALILELNRVRTDPAAYAELYLAPRRQYYQGDLYSEPGQISIRTNEGVSALDECIRVLTRSPAREPLDPTPGLARAARDHAQDTGPRGITGHEGTDGSRPWERVARYENWGGYVGENVSYGHNNARDILIQLLVDDGVPSRGHRENIMRAEYSAIGVAIGRHSTYDWMCVLDFAGRP